VPYVIGVETHDDQRRSGPRTPRIPTALMWIGLLALMVSVACGRAGLGNAVLPSPTPNVRIGGPQIDWNQPLGGAVVGSTALAAPYLSFSPVAPANLGTPIKIMVDSSSPDGSGLEISWVYQHPVYGRFFFMEGKSGFSQSSLEALAGCDPSSGCQGQWTLVRLASGVNGLLITGEPTTAIFWLWNGLTLETIGPYSSFSVADAEAVANDF
jgi:hypothetical protein